MFYVYVLFRKETKRNFYVGFTKDLKKRMRSHYSEENSGYTKARNWTLVYYEAYLSEHDARKRERRLKNGRVKRQLIERIQASLGELK